MSIRSIGVIGWLDRPSGHYRDYAGRFLSVLRQVPDTEIDFYVTTSSFSLGDFDGHLQEDNFFPILEEEQSPYDSTSSCRRLRYRSLLMRRAIHVRKMLDYRSNHCTPIFLAVDIPTAYIAGKLGLLPRNAVFVVHNLGRAEDARTSLKNKIYTNMVVYVIGYSKAIIVLEPCVKKAISRFAPQDLVNRVFVVPDPRSMDTFECSNVHMQVSCGEQRRFLLIGTLTPSKGIELAIKAFEDLIKTIPDAKLVVAGRPCSDQYGRTIEDFCRRLPVDSCELVLRQLSHEEYADQIRNADFGLLPYEGDVGSRSSGVLWDMLSMGKYVIMSSVPGFQDIHSTYGIGLVFETGNSSSLTNAMISAIVSNDWVADHNAGLERLRESYSYRAAARVLDLALRSAD